MPHNKNGRKRRAKRYHLEISLTSMFFWGVGGIFLLAWIFVLGVFVGRGLLPEGVKTLSKLRLPITKLQNMVGKRKPSELDFIKKLDKDPKLSFYKELSTKKEEAKRTSPRQTEVGGQKSGREYTVQIASLDSEIGASKVTKRLTSCGYPAYFYRVNIKGKDYFRVRCGRFSTRKEASDFNAMLAIEEKIRGFVTRLEE
jgi:hypothetical protein